MALPLIPILAGAAIGGVLMGFLGGSNEGAVSSTATPSSVTNQNQYSPSYNVTIDNSYNAVSNSPFGSIKKGDMGTLTSSPYQNAIPTVTAEQTPSLDQSSQMDMTGLLVLCVVGVAGYVAYKELI